LKIKDLKLDNKARVRVIQPEPLMLNQTINDFLFFPEKYNQYDAK